MRIMDRHSHCGEVLGPYLLEALKPAEEREVERHLIGCPGCRREAETLFSVHQLLNSIQGEVMIAAPPPGLKARILEGFSCRGRTNP